MIAIRLDNIRRKLSNSGLNAILVTSRHHVKYLSGFSGSDGDLLITLDAAYILHDSRYSIQVMQEAPMYTPINISEGIYNVINRLIATHCISVLGVEDREISLAMYNSMRRLITGASIIPVKDMISSMRIIKDENEILNIEKAAEIADLAFTSVLPLIKPGISEIEIAAEIEYVMRKNGASKPSFDTIVASGANASKPHGTASAKKVENGDFIVMDFGCVYNGYCSDITRTVAVGNIDDSMKLAYNSLLYTQLKMINLVKAGKSCKFFDTCSRNILDMFGFSNFFTHSLGHGVGLNVHETPTLSPKCDTILEENMVVTIEPGIYFDSLFGIRIEDTVQILANGVKTLTKSPKDLVII